MSEGLKFEHLVEVDAVNGSDPAHAHAGIQQVGAARLWRGLLLRVEFPQNFQPALESCDIVRLDDGQLLRTLHFGAQQVRDRVRIDAAAARIAIDVIAAPGTAQASLAMEVVRPAAGGLWVRFSYCVQSPDHHPDAPLGGYVKDAWRQADEETVFRIRQLCASGVLDPVLN